MPFDRWGALRARVKSEALKPGPKRSFGQSPPIRHALHLLLFLLLLLPQSARTATGDLGEATRGYQQGKFDAALAALDRFEKSSPPDGESLDLRGCIYLEQQKFDEAKKAFDAAHAASPNIFAPRLHVGDVLLRQKKFAEARAIYQELLRETNILVSNERLRFAIMLTYLGERDEANAQKAFQAVTFPTETPAYYYTQAAWAFAHGKKSEAQDWINKTRKMFDPDAPLWFAHHLYHFGWLTTKPPLSRKHD
jgi:predicted Zn-dependent protease